MSERMTNIEVEDVLASIRRLVLEGTGNSVAGVPRPPEPRPEPRPVPRDASQEAPRDPAGGRLVLTPALRVARPAPAAEPAPAPRPDPRAGIEEAVAARAEAWEPDGEEGPVPDASTGAALFHHRTRLADPAPPEPSASPALDREALRALVAEVVREEFAGELGERITRNIRKLVQREIARALAERDIT